MRRGSSASAAVADTFAMSGELKAELEMMTWRREVFLGRESKVMGPFTEALQARPGLCADSVPLCQRMLMAGLSAHDDDAHTAALSGWLVEQVRRGPHQLDLALSAAQAAEDLGAPGSRPTCWPRFQCRKSSWRRTCCASSTCTFMVATSCAPTLCSSMLRASLGEGRPRSGAGRKRVAASMHSRTPKTRTR